MFISSDLSFDPTIFYLQVETQRVQYKRLPRTIDPFTRRELGVQPNKRLTTERLQKLEAIGFAWSAKHVCKTANPSDPKKRIVENNPTPVSDTTCWNSRQNVRGPETRRNNRKSYDDQWVSLFGHFCIYCHWANADQFYCISWKFQEVMFDMLREYKSKFGDCLVPKRYKENPKLGTCKCMESPCCGKNLHG
jgi:hypothetical protein